MSLARWKLLLAIVSVLELAACSTTRIPPEYRAQYAGLSDDQIDLIVRSDEAHQELLRQGMISQEASLTRYVEGITARLLKPVQYALPPQLHIRVYVLRDPQINAMAMPNGNIYVNEGLLVRFQNEAQLAFVLGHEVSHVTEQHSLKARQATKTTSVLLNTAGMVLDPNLSIMASMLYLSNHSRDAESESDLKGLDLMCTAGYQADQSVKAIELLLEAKSADAMTGSIWGSHPGLKDRMKNLGQAGLANPNCAGSEVEEGAFTAVITDQVIQDVIEMKQRRRSYQSAFDVSQARAIQRPHEVRYVYLMGESLRLKARDPKGAAEESLYLEAGSLPSEVKVTAKMKAYEAERPETEARSAKYLQEAIALDPGFAPAYRGLGLLAQQQGLKDEAKSQLSRYLELAPTAKDKLFVASLIKSIK